MLKSCAGTRTVRRCWLHGWSASRVTSHTSGVWRATATASTARSSLPCWSMCCQRPHPPCVHGALPAALRMCWCCCTLPCSHSLVGACSLCSDGLREVMPMPVCPRLLAAQACDFIPGLSARDHTCSVHAKQLPFLTMHTPCTWNIQLRSTCVAHCAPYTRQAAQALQGAASSPLPPTSHNRHSLARGGTARRAGRFPAALPLLVPRRCRRPCRRCRP